MPETRARLQHAVVMPALDDVAARRPVAEITAAGPRAIGDQLIVDELLRVRGRHSSHYAQANRCESQGGHTLFRHDRNTPFRDSHG